MRGNIYKNKGRGSPWILRFGKITRRFKDYGEAERYLTGLRFKTDEGSFDPRDYRQDQPLGFTNYSEKWFDKAKHKGNKRPHLRHAQAFFGQQNIKELKYGDFEDFLNTLSHLSTKYQKDILDTVKTMYRWAFRREDIKKIPEFPPTPYSLKLRKLVTKEDQQRILGELKRIAPFKVWLAIKWLSTYPSIRPNELRHIREGDIDRDRGTVLLGRTKTGEPRIVPLLPEDVDLVRTTERTFPAAYFFRHDRRKGVNHKHTKQFGQRCLYSWWKRGCAACGVSGVDLYGGTKHSTVTALRKHFSPEEIKRATMHKTNKAFERYFQVSEEDLRKVYAKAGGDQKVNNLSDHPNFQKPQQNQKVAGRHDEI